MNNRRNDELVQTYVSDAERELLLSQDVNITPFGDESPDEQVRASFAQALLDNNEKKPVKPVKRKKEKEPKKPKAKSEVPGSVETTSRALRLIVTGAFIAGLLGLGAYAVTTMNLGGGKDAIATPDAVVSESTLPDEEEGETVQTESGDAQVSGEVEESGEVLLTVAEITGNAEEVVITTAETTTTATTTTTTTTLPPTTAAVQQTLPANIPTTTYAPVNTTIATTRRTAGQTVRTTGEYGTTMAPHPVVHIENITLPAEYGEGYMDAQAAMWIINRLRVNAGVPELDFTDPQLINATRNRLLEVCGCFDKSSTNISRLSDQLRSENIGFKYCCECLVGGAFTAEQTVGEWLNNPTNSMNIYDARMHAAYIIFTTSAEGLPVWVFDAMAYN